MVEKDIRIDELIGAREPEPVPTAPDILGLLVAELERVENWQVIDSGAAIGVLLGDALPPADDELVARPDAVLEVRQTLVPLGLRLDQFGNAAVGDHDTFSLDVGDGDLVPTGDVDDWFAVAQFLALTAAEQARRRLRRIDDRRGCGSGPSASPPTRAARRRSRTSSTCSTPAAHRRPRART